MAVNKNAAVITIRRRDTIALPPCKLGFSSLVEPDLYDPDKPMFKLNGHYNPAGMDALREVVERECFSENNMKRLREEQQGNPGMKAFLEKEPISVSDWLAAKLKQPKENSKIPLPYIVIGCRAVRKDRKGEPYTVTLGCWDGHNSSLDLKALKLGMNSVIQPIVAANVYVSKTVNGCAPSPKLDLVGIRVLQLVRFGGARPPQETDDEAIREVLGDEFVMDEDLSQYASSSTPLPGAQPPAPDAGDVIGGAF
jgi:hypothetical protein